MAAFPHLLSLKQGVKWSCCVVFFFNFFLPRDRHFAFLLENVLFMSKHDEGLSLKLHLHKLT